MTPHRVCDFARLSQIAATKILAFANRERDAYAVVRSSTGRPDDPSDCANAVRLSYTLTLGHVRDGRHTLCLARCQSPAPHYAGVALGLGDVCLQPDAANRRVAAGGAADAVFTRS